MSTHFLLSLSFLMLISPSLIAQQLLYTLGSNESYIHDARFSPDDQYIVSGSHDGQLRLWNRYGDLETKIPAHEGAVYAVAFSRDGKSLYSAGHDHQLKAWSLSGTLQDNFPTQGRVQDIHCSEKDRLQIASVQQSDIFQLLTNHMYHIPASLFTTENVAITDKGGMVLCTAKQGKRLELRDQHGQEIFQSGKHPKGILAVAASQQGQYFLSGGRNRRLMLWTADGKSQQEMAGHTAAITALAISQCSEYIVSGDLQGNILLWNRRGKLLKRIPAHAWCVSSLSFSADGQLLLSASWDGTVKVWSLASALAIWD